MTIETTRPTEHGPTSRSTAPKSSSSARSTSPAPAIPYTTPKPHAPGRAQTTPQPNPSTGPIPASAAGPQASRGHWSRDTQTDAASAVDLPGDQGSIDAQWPLVAGGAGGAGRPPATDTSPSNGSSPLADPFLALAADVVDDLEKVRIANENRLRQLTRTATDADGEERGFGLTADHPDVARLAALVDMLGDAEHKAVLNLARLLRQHPLHPWIKARVGLGEKQAARLLAAIGDPYWNTLHNRPRTVSELWAYCGYHVLPARRTLRDTHVLPAGGTNFPADHRHVDALARTVGGEQTGHPDHSGADAHRVDVGVAAKRARGQRANWSATAKMRAFLIAESCVKQRSSPYRKVYDDARDKYADAVHAVPCVRCGPAGKPAPEGSPLSDGHKHARALRAVAKAVLKDLWREAKRIHEAARAAE